MTPSEREAKPMPNPGSDEAVKLGCECPVIDNLEWCSSRDNQRHSYRTGLRKSLSASGHKYIYHDKTNRKWRVIITNPDGSKSRLGRYPTIAKAIEARDLILKEYA